MANKLKADVRFNEDPEVSHIDLELTPEQAVILLESVMTGRTVIVNLQSPQPRTGLRDTPLAYAS